MELIIFLGLIGLIAVLIYKLTKDSSDPVPSTSFSTSSRLVASNPLAHLPERFVVFDIETTGLDSERHEILEIGAIRVNRNSNNHDTFQVLVKPSRKVPKKITELTGITPEMIEAEGVSLESAVQDFAKFAGNLRLVSFNAEFDMAFISKAAGKSSITFANPVSCALKMSRRAWPDRKSYRLAEIAKDGNLDTSDMHRALGDCQRAAIVYCAAASRLGTVE
ncbi:DNA-directed DNA polymerase [Cupriavidus necator]|uniref:DNA-directed DNA polymerase n=1 Tax=Cupriavidus necator (strain ATCC 17699 / DSM 428 / KCTC 22496 / NCIMB 10442 / H16 / Stanier 337) TaxID=381666 RepID=Q0JYK3_CUPNH|nr:3'-5' exonuclease [Cupriavidus necator]QCC04941.1 3'-5' exonuclease [Cupriavidus necator H16]QQB79628.1 3'-5' exonuclease [Cupriavidus necator]WKA43871.1 3'-5' exonuclease [Cupriavidus necator]CAJ97171.1 putative exonuclease [Cupriavidus necator H16]